MENLIVVFSKNKKLERAMKLRLSNGFSETYMARWKTNESEKCSLKRTFTCILAN